jgi:hypothetical protein
MDDRDRPRDRQYGQGSDYYNRAAERWQDDRSAGYGDRGGYYDRGYGERGYGERGYGDRGYSDRGYGYGTYGSTGSGDRAFGFGDRDARQGQYSGMGPKGYQRSDARINEDVCDRLCAAGDIDASEIEVRVDNGEVTLSGAVSDRADKRRAEDLIEHVSGVREVHNNLRVSRQDEAGGVGRTGVLGLNTDTGGANQAGSGSARTRTAGAGAGAGGVDIPNPGITGGGASGASNMNPTRR